jgi:hypothetical protein
MKRSAYISLDGLYRYTLARSWVGEGLPGNSGFVTFILLNPSTADGQVDDPTVRRCINFAKRWRMDGLLMVNLFGLRASNPRALLTVKDPIGPDNDTKVLDACHNSKWIIAGWGTQEGDLGRLVEKRAVEIRLRLVCGGHRNLYALGVTRSGAPRHPLYVAAHAEPSAWPPRAEATA